MKTTLILLFSLISITVFSQKAYEPKQNHLPIKYVLKTNNKDTLSSRIVASYPFKMDHFTPDTFVKKIKLVSEKGKEIIPISEVKYMEITDFDGVVFKYITSDEFPQMNISGSILQILYYGKKIKAIRSFQRIDLMGNTASSEFTFDNKDLVSTTIQYSKKNKLLINRLEKYPDLLEKYKNVHTQQDYIEVLKEYEMQ